MSQPEDFELRLGRIRDVGGRRAKSFLNQALRAAEAAGGPVRGRRGGRRFGRGGSATLRAARHGFGRNRGAVVKARVVRHGSGAPMAAHLAYLKRDGVTKDGQSGRLFDAAGDEADGKAFAGRCADDRHHFRFIVSPDDGEQMADLKAFTRDLMGQAAEDLGTRLDWVAVEHRNTAHPHLHVLVRGVADDGRDLVISRDYISWGLRARAGALVDLELGPRSAQEIAARLDRDVVAQRYTALDRLLTSDAELGGGIIDLRPTARSAWTKAGEVLRLAKCGRVATLRDLGLAEEGKPGRWRLSPNLQATLQALGREGDVIGRLHDALKARAADFDLVATPMPFVGRLAGRGLDDELKGSAYVVVDGLDGRVRHVSVADLAAASDAPIGAVVEVRGRGANGDQGPPSVRVLSDLTLEAQIDATGPTWLDRNLIYPKPLAPSGFGAEVTAALEARGQGLAARGLTRRRGDRWVLASDLLARLRRVELLAARDRLQAELGGSMTLAKPGEMVEGIYSRRLDLAAGRFAVLEGAGGFVIAPWTAALEPHRGRAVSGALGVDGGVRWTLQRQRGAER